MAGAADYSLLLRPNFKIVLNDYSSFVLQQFTLELNSPLLIASLYCPYKYNADFLNEFADFWGEFLPKYDQLLIIGDFNVQLCCTTDPLAKEFITLINVKCSYPSG